MKTFYLMTTMVASALAGSALMPLAAHAEASGVAPVRDAKVTEAKAPTASYSMAQAGKLVEDYFNAFTTMSAWFSQHSSNDQWSFEGTLLVKKPGQFVWSYQTPHKQRIIGTGTNVYYVDDEGGQVTQLPIQGGIGKIIGAREVHLDKLGFRVTHVNQQGNELAVTLSPVKPDNQLKSITLTFNVAAKPQLTGILVIDGVGSATQVSLSNIQTGVSIDPKVFKFTPPQYQNN
jgi:outer membrane lipoprotein carrier protein